MTSTYKFRGIPLTSGIATEILPRIFANGEAANRPQIVSRVIAHHAELGGLQADGDATTMVKKALSVLAKENRVESVSHGFWRFTTPPTEAGRNEPIDAGDGDETVYVYYFPAYQDQAAHLGKDTWPIKIGMTKGEAPRRITEQSSTCMPETPIVGLRYKCKNAAHLERAIHLVLKSRNKHITGAPGKEWFMSSVNEVLSIISFTEGSE
jgi:hypothetical protein